MSILMYHVSQHIHGCRWGDNGLEYDQNAPRQALVDWLDQANGCTLFDFVTKGVLQEAVKNCEYWRLIDPEGKAPGLLGWWPSRAVTFITNHVRSCGHGQLGCSRQLCLAAMMQQSVHASAVDTGTCNRLEPLCLLSTAWANEAVSKPLLPRSFTSGALHAGHRQHTAALAIPPRQVGDRLCLHHDPPRDAHRHVSGPLSPARARRVRVVSPLLADQHALCEWRPSALPPRPVCVQVGGYL